MNHVSSLKAAVASLLLALAASMPAKGAEVYTFTTVAGQSAVGTVDGVGTAARFTDPIGIASDAQGNLYVVELNANILRKITREGVVTTIAGSPGSSDSRDGIGTAASFNNPSGVAVDADGVIYVVESGNGAIRKITPDAAVRTLAGGRYGSSDGLGNAAGFRNPGALAVDANRIIYVADTYNHTIRRIDPEGMVTTLAGQAGSEGSADGTGPAARFSRPSGIAVDAEGILYVADAGNHTIRRITPAGVVSTLAGMVNLAGWQDGPADSARFAAPSGVALDGKGNIYVADAVNSMVRKIDASGRVSTTAQGFYGHRSLTVDPVSGDLFVADVGSHTIKRVTPAGAVTIFAGTTVARGSVDGVGTQARFTTPNGLKFDRAGNLFVADSNAHAIRRITPAGYVTTWAGRIDHFGFSDGLGTGAALGGPWAMTIDAEGNLIFTEVSNHAVRRMGPDGQVTLLAGGGNGSTDGLRSAARFNFPGGVAVDAQGSIYVADTNSSTIRKIDAEGRVTTPFGIAGSNGHADALGTAARFNSPSGLVFDAAGNLYVCDLNNHAIRKISPAGEVSTFAGHPSKFGSVDGVGPAASFWSPAGIAIDGHGNLFVADRSSHTIRKITPDGDVTTIGGLSGTSGFVDGTGSDARFNMPHGIEVDRFGNLYLSEWANNTIRKGVVAGAKAPAFSKQPASIRVGAGANAAFVVAAMGPPQPLLQWERKAAGASAFVALSEGETFKGVNTSTLTISAAPASMDGDQFRCVAENGILPLATSSTATLTVVPPPPITSEATTSFTIGAPGRFVVTAPSATSFKIADGDLPAWATFDATTGVLSGTPPDATGAPFTFVIQAFSAAVLPTAQSFTLNVNAGPVITSAPQAQLANAGTTVVLSAGAAGLPPLTMRWTKDGTPLADSARLSGTATNQLSIARTQLADSGAYALSVTGADGTVVSTPAMLSIVTPPDILQQPQSQTVEAGARVSFSVSATSSTPLRFQWMFNNQPIPGANASLYATTATNSNWTGQYSVRVSDSATSIVSAPAILNVLSPAKRSGFADEVGSDITHLNGNVYDQALLTGVTASFKADAGQVLRVSFIDLSDDIVQVEFSGAGTLHLRLDGASGPAAPAHYNQTVHYMKGHAMITIAGADETTHLSVFTVGSVTALNQALFRDDVVYDGFADISSISITSANGKFGGIYAGNANFFDTRGIVGVYAPGVQFTGSLVLGNVDAAESARAMLLLGAATAVRIAGGDLRQTNRQSVQVSGLEKLKFIAGASSHGVSRPAQHNQATLERNGSDVTAELVENPEP